MQDIKDLSKYKVGEISPQSGKKIKTILALTENTDRSYAVYIDDDDEISTLFLRNDPSIIFSYGDIPHKVNYWVSVCNSVFSRQEAYKYKCILARAYVSLFSGEEHHANQIINQSSEDIKSNGKKILQQEYIIASLYFLFLIVVLLPLAYYSTNSEIVKPIYLVALVGAVGAFVSNIFRLNDYNPDISSNKFISKVDGILRIIYGLSTASLVYLGIKANIIFGFLNAMENNIYGYLFIAAIAGASERLFPSIVKQLEDKETNS